jgi:hypothetical protein
LNGLYHARRHASGIDFARIADGSALALAVDASRPGGRVWVGFTTQVELQIPDVDDIAPGASVPLTPAKGALLVVDPGDDPHDPAAASLRWALPNEDAVTALLVDPAAPARGAWVGTPYGLGWVALDGEPTLAPAAVELLDGLAVVGLEATRQGFWIAARHECERDRGRLLRVRSDAAGAVEAVDDFSEAGFGERDFAWVRELASGEVLVSTLVPSLGVATGERAFSARGCPPPPAGDRTADLYSLSPDGRLERFGAWP